MLFERFRYDEAYRLFGEALNATGRPIVYSICPLIAGCDASIWTYYKDYAHMSMNQCVQKDNTDTFASLLYHIDDNNAFPERALAAGPGYWNDLDFLMVGYKELKAWEQPQTLQECVICQHEKQAGEAFGLIEPCSSFVWQLSGS